jgi:hypothetical protein
MSLPRKFAARFVGLAIALFARFITAVRADWQGIEPINRQVITMWAA